jgi:hypothetical protein
MITQKEHKKDTLMRWSKEELAEHIMMLEHNINALNESFENQYSNCLKLLDDMKLLNKTFWEAKEIIKRSELKGGE